MLFRVSEERLAEVPFLYQRGECCNQSPMHGEFWVSKEGQERPGWRTLGLMSFYKQAGELRTRSAHPYTGVIKMFSRPFETKQRKTLSL